MNYKQDLNYLFFITASPFHLKWAAPEAYTRGHYTTKSDVWSYGITLYEIICDGLEPYQGKYLFLIFRLFMSYY